MATNKNRNDHPSFARNWIPLSIALVALAVLPLFLIHDRPPGLALEDVKEAGQLKMLTINSPTTYYEGPGGPVGLEYDLAQGLAQHLRVELVIETADSIASIFPRLTRGDAHFAGAGLIVSAARPEQVRFTNTYYQIRHQVVYLRGKTKPNSIEELVGREITVVAGSGAAQRLSEIKVDHPDLSWQETSDHNAEDLLQEVWHGALDLTIADSDMVAVSQQHFPQLRPAFDLEPARDLAWAFPLNDDNSIFDLTNQYLQTFRESGELNSLIERYYGPAESFDHINVSKFRERIALILPRFRKMFIDAADDTGQDWRLIAAQAYQESQWDPDAVSPTMVRGIMQLTEATAELMKVSDRRDPRQSIFGGARYLVTVTKKIPERIREPDRTWLGLAAYNIGFGHLEDARVITQTNGKDPDKWADVKENLPLLTDEVWASKTKYGAARGNEAVDYVNRVRAFYDILVRLEPDQNQAKGND